jgi:hypothetical protein
MLRLWFERCLDVMFDKQSPIAAVSWNNDDTGEMTGLVAIAVGTELAPMFHKAIGEIIISTEKTELMSEPAKPLIQP